MHALITRHGRPRMLLAALAGVGVAYLTAVAWLLWWVLVAAVVPAWTPVVVTSGSMAPAIRTGDLVIISAVAPEEVAPGHVVVFDDPGRGLVTHRVVDVEAGALRTQGDANRQVDSRPVDRSEVRGRGRLLVPAVGLPLVWAARADWLHVAAVAVTTVLAWLTVQGWMRAADRATRSGGKALISFAGGGP
jgi:signal peptidase I